MTPSPTPSPVETPPPGSETQGGGLPWWFWLAVVVGAGVVGWLMLAPRRDWDKRFVRAGDEARWADRELISRVLSRPTTAEADAVWQPGRQRLQATVEELKALGAADVSKERRDRATRLELILANLVAAMDAQVAPEPAGADLRGAVARVEAVRAELRVELDGTSGGGSSG